MRNLKISVFIILTFGAVLFSGCHDNGSGDNQFSSTADTLHVRTSRVKGTSVFDFIAGSVAFQDTTNLFNYPVDYPDSLINITGVRQAVDPRNKLDYIDMIGGQLPSRDYVVIVDQNNNHSFRDDSVFTLQSIDWYSSRNSVPVTFSIFDGADTIQSHSWIRMGYWKEAILFGRDEHLSAAISIDGKRFSFGIIDSPFCTSFGYGLEPEIALLATGQEEKDSIEVRDLIKLKEYLKINDVFYKFDSISNDGSYLRLVKEMNFANKVGTQIGMLAPDFIFKSTSGDTVNTSLLNDKPLIVANSCGCGGDMESSAAYFEMRETFREDAYVLGLDSHFPKNSPDEWTINMGDEFNKDCYDKFRQAYCSRICYVVGLNRRIVNKFQITNWKENLPKSLTHNIK
jgi:hypothetical protein